MSGLAAAETRVLVLDDHGIVRQGIIGLLERQADVRVVGQAGRLSEALAWDVEADVILADLVLPDGRGAEVVTRLHERFPDSAILVLSMVDNPTDVRQAFAAGARGYLLKEAASEDLAEAVRRVARGEDYLEPSLGMALAGLRVSIPAPRVPAAVELTDRERAVLRLIALGHTNSEIASILAISLRTVESHRSHLLQKTNLQTRADLVRLAIDSGIALGD